MGALSKRECSFYFFVFSRSSVSVDSLSQVPSVFLDPEFSLKKAETFAKIFPFLFQNSKDSLSSQIETHGRSTHEKLAQHLDSVEVNIADQVAQKSHHFFQVSFKQFSSNWCVVIWFHEFFYTTPHK